MFFCDLKLELLAQFQLQITEKQHKPTKEKGI